MGSARSSSSSCTARPAGCSAGWSWGCTGGRRRPGMDPARISKARNSPRKRSRLQSHRRRVFAERGSISANSRAAAATDAICREGLRDYVRKGYGGRATAVRRFGGTASTAGHLYGALSSVAGGQAAAPEVPSTRPFLPVDRRGEVMDAIVEAVRPADGTQDAEASRAAIKDALSELLTMFPDADLFNLTEDQRGTAIERFVAIDVYQRAVLDIGKTIQDKAPTATVGLARLKEVKDYIKQTVAAAFRKLRGAGQRVTTGPRQPSRSRRPGRNLSGIRGIQAMKLICAPKTTSSRAKPIRWTLSSMDAPTGRRVEARAQPLG